MRSTRSWAAIQRRTKLGRGAAIGVAYLICAIAIVAVGATFLPKLIDEVNGFVQATPGYVDDLTHGRGRLGFLETKYHVVEKVRAQVENGGALEGARPLGRGALGHEERDHDRRSRP